MNPVQLYKKIPKNLINEKIKDELLSFFSNQPKPITGIGSILLKELTKDGSIQWSDLIDLIGYFHQKRKEDEDIWNTNKRKHFGIYYTPYSIARRLVSETVGNSIEDVENKTFYEPCVGSGVFIIAYLDEIIERSKDINSKFIQKIIDNIYYSDIDEDAVGLFESILVRYIEGRYGVTIKPKKENKFIGDVLFSMSSDGLQIKKVNPKDIFNVDGFDFIITNPPYKLLKANSDKYSEASYVKEIKNLLSYIRKNNIYKYNEGTLNYYKIFIEEIIENYSKKNSRLGLLVPTTILNDKQSTLLRKHIIEDFELGKVYIIPEKNDFFQDITQAFTFFSINKGDLTRNIKIVKDISNERDFDKGSYLLKKETIKKISRSYSLTITDNKGIDILEKIASNPKLANLGILNLRGELDLTLHKGFISNEKTEFPLLRGTDITDFSIKGFGFYTKSDFLKNIGNKSSHVKSKRIVGQQISNMKNKKRLKFAFVPSGYVLGNSCNYLVLEDNLFGKKDISLEYLLGILNSKLIDWRFRITNSNNHVSNYEISELPIALPKTASQKRDVEMIVQKLMEQKDQKLENDLNEMIFNLYNINKTESGYINEYYAT